MAIEGRKHIWFKHEDRCPDPGDCLYCDGGITECTICGGAEGSLATECPGTYLSFEMCDAVYNGCMDFVNGEWVAYWDHIDPVATE